MNILVTGTAGFIGFHLAKSLLERGDNVLGFDNFNDYYDPKIKEERNKILKKYPNFKIIRGDLENLEAIKNLFKENKIDKICHLAAQAGVRYSITHPHVYIKSNIVGFANLIDEARHAGIKDFIFASSSSVYGNNKKIPFSVKDPVDEPISLYAATKKANELSAYTYHHLYGMNCTGLRFFTAYGPWGRPDMSLFLFTKAILENKPIDVFNFGKMKRDFTYIDDIVSGIIASLDKSYPYEIFNLGNNNPVDLEYFIQCIENSLGKKAVKNYLPMQPGDVPASFADIDYSIEKLGFRPKTSIEQGVDNFINWYKEYFEINIIAKSHKFEPVVCLVGLGYVGLPLAYEFSKAGVKVYGFDNNSEKIEKLKAGIDPTNEVGEKLKTADIEFTADPAIIKKANFIIAAIPTPVDKNNNPDLSLVESASAIIGKNLSQGSYVVFESTVYPGVTEDICLPILERESGLSAGKDFFYRLFSGKGQSGR